MRTGEGWVTSEAKEEFERRGYHVLRNALSPEEVATYRNALARILLLPPTHPYFSSLAKSGLPQDLCPPDNPHGLWAGFDLPLFADCFYDLIFHPRIALAVDALIGPDN